MIHDVYRPCGAWRLEPNDSYTIDANEQSVYLEYGHPRDVPELMDDVIQRLNTAEAKQLAFENATRRSTRRSCIFTRSGMATAASLA
jgi:hypothetical protein